MIIFLALLTTFEASKQLGSSWEVAKIDLNLMPNHHYQA